VKTLLSLFIVSGFFLSSCGDEQTAVNEDRDFILKETGLDIGTEPVKIGQHTENYESDYTTMIVYHIPLMNVSAFLKRIEKSRKISDGKGEWLTHERHIYFRPNIGQAGKSLFVTLDYSYESQVLVVCKNKI
jgi:hypothetical protein